MAQGLKFMVLFGRDQLLSYINSEDQEFLSSNYRNFQFAWRTSFYPYKSELLKSFENLLDKNSGADGVSLVQLLSGGKISRWIKSRNENRNDDADSITAAPTLLENDIMLKGRENFTD